VGPEVPDPAAAVLVGRSAAGRADKP